MSLRPWRRLGALTLLLAITSCRCGTPEVGAPLQIGSERGHSQAWLEGRLEPEPEGIPRAGGTLSVRVAEEPGGLCPLHDRMQGRVAERFLVGPVYETLLTTTGDGRELRPLLAEGWTSNPEGTAHLFRLREGVRFHDGSPLTAQDVAATLSAVRSGMNVTTAARARLGPIDRVQVLDPLTVEVRWTSASVAGLRALGLTLPILPAHALAEGFNTAAILNRPIGTGPFRVSAWNVGTSLTLERNEAYWDGPALLDRVILHFVPDAEEAARRFADGDFDLMTGISPTLWRSMEGEAWSHDVRRMRVIENTPQVLVWNQTRPTLAEADVRRALASLLPDAAVNAELEAGLNAPTRCPLHPSTPACGEAGGAQEADPEAAGQRLLEAGWVDTDGDGIRERDGTPLRIRLAYAAGSQTSRQLVGILQPHWRAAGIDLEGVALPWSELMEALQAGEFDAVAMAWPMRDVEASLAPLVHAENPAGINYGGHADPELDALLERHAEAFDAEARAALTQAILARFEANPPFLVVSFRPRLEAMGTAVRGMRDTLVWPPLQQLWLEADPLEEVTSEAGRLQ